MEKFAKWSCHTSVFYWQFWLTCTSSKKVDMFSEKGRHPFKGWWDMSAILYLCSLINKGDVLTIYEHSISIPLFYSSVMARVPLPGLHVQQDCQFCAFFKTRHPSRSSLPCPLFRWEISISHITDSDNGRSNSNPTPSFRLGSEKVLKDTKKTLISYYKSINIPATVIACMGMFIPWKIPRSAPE